MSKSLWVVLWAFLCGPWGCAEELRTLRSAGSACESAEQCASNLCFESVCGAVPPSEPPEPEARVEEAPLDCAELCALYAACGVGEAEESDDACQTFCEENPLYVPPRVWSCAAEHLAEGRCDVDAFLPCADGPIVRFFNAVAEEVCDHLATCCLGSGQTPFGTVSECADLVGGIAGGFINATELMGYLTFDASVAETCRPEVGRTLDETPCEALPADLGPYLGELLACEGLMTPLQGEGDPCGIPSDDGYVALVDGCLEDLLCVGASEVMPTCERGVPPGGACEGEALPCGRSSVCVSGLCATPVSQGEPCGVDEACASSDCEEGVCGAARTMECPP